MTWHLVSSVEPTYTRPNRTSDGRGPGRASPAREGGHAAVREGVLSKVLGVVRRGRAKTPPLSDAERAAFLRDACDALRLGRFNDVRVSLSRGGNRVAGDAAGLNLLGVLCEAGGERRAARRYYGQAIRADRRFGPAQQNMRRAYELDTLGRTDRPVAVGDAVTDLWLARNTTPRRPLKPR